VGIEVLDASEDSLHLRAQGRRSAFLWILLGVEILALVVFALVYLGAVGFAVWALTQGAGPVVSSAIWAGALCYGLPLIMAAIGLPATIASLFGDEHISVDGGVLDVRREYRQMRLSQGSIDLSQYPPVEIERSESRRGVQQIRVRGRRAVPVAFGAGLTREEAERAVGLIRVQLDRHRPPPLGPR
jgi:hypothetical protein